MVRNFWDRNYEWKFPRVVHGKAGEVDLEKEGVAVMSADTALQIAVAAVDSDNNEVPVAQAVAIVIVVTVPAVPVPDMVVPEMEAATASAVAISTTEREKVAVTAVDPVLAMGAAEDKVEPASGLGLQLPIIVSKHQPFNLKLLIEQYKMSVRY